MNTQTKSNQLLEVIFRTRESWGTMAIPKEGEFVTIQSYKHDGHLHRTWRDTMVLKTSEYSLIGVNDHTLVTESDGRRWVTREPAIVYFHKKYWFNIIAMIREKGFLITAI